jgi:hypothetical protein
LILKIVYKHLSLKKYRRNKVIVEAQNFRLKEFFNVISKNKKNLTTLHIKNNIIHTIYQSLTITFFRHGSLVSITFTSATKKKTKKRAK